MHDAFIETVLEYDTGSYVIDCGQFPLRHARTIYLRHRRGCPENQKNEAYQPQMSQPEHNYSSCHGNLDSIVQCACDTSGHSLAPEERNVYSSWLPQLRQGRHQWMVGSRP